MSDAAVSGPEHAIVSVTGTGESAGGSGGEGGATVTPIGAAKGRRRGKADA